MNLSSFNCDPVSIILVTAGSRGQKVLFRYPVSTDKPEEVAQESDPTKSFYDVSKTEDVSAASFSDTTLANILTPKVELSGKTFLLKIDNVIFVGHPMELQGPLNLKRCESSKNQENVMLKLFNVVFVLKAGVENSVINCYHDLSKRIAIALKHEEHRCCYLTRQRENMLAVHDEISSMPEDSAENPFEHMLPKSTLARDLKDAFQSLCETGVVQLMVNGWVNVSFCLPHKVHNLNQGILRVPPKAIEASLAAMRPYHTLLFLVEEDALLASLPGDCSPALTRLVRRASPLKSFTTLSQDTDIPLSQIFAIAAHLVYWGKASIIFPLCESNVYAVAPSIPVDMSSPLVDEFSSRFPKISLHETLAEFSLPSPLAEHYNPLSLPQQQAEKVQMVVWMLQHRLLIQLQTYVFLVPSAKFDQQSDPSSGARGRRRIRWIFGGSYTDTFLPFTDKEPVDTMEPTAINKIIDSVRSLSFAEKMSIMQTPASSDEEDLKLFARLVPYFRGKHHIEEIMYYNNLRRSKLLTLIDKFKDVLFLCQHEDPATASFHCS
ncbi:GATOR complex protein NPRL3 [Exaiptasia diaphana]|uniref:GATOR complex protein NPRL3 n=1 Tax=Exaiptasia diaphana TaxID=2652724 RepID=A0A913XDK8_EXADI|nr:GATOR complex protein NPRL3 [Exaiptasia diaphana]KXJ20483.1 Nitrogen permease regulator 3-like protein [Exaiptasia diaphana]